MKDTDTWTVYDIRVSGWIFQVVGFLGCDYFFFGVALLVCPFFFLLRSLRYSLGY